MNHSLPLKTLFPFLCILTLSACGVELVDTDSGDAPAATVQAPDYQVEALSEPNQYDIRFRDGIRAQMMSDHGTFLQARPAFFEGGRVYQFLLTSERSSARVQIAIPKDLVVASSEPKPEQTEMSFRTTGRLFLSRETLLTNFEKPLELEADEIVSDGARIQNFYSGSHAALGKTGRTGGSIRIRARKISGRLWIGLRGENGGEGLPGEPWARPAYTGLSYTGGMIYNGCAFYIQGGRGGDGKPGHQGKPGEQGGNSGSLYLEVADTSLLDLQIDKTPGRGGIGGKGGPGQPGGAGGASTAKPKAQVVPGTGPESAEKDETFDQQIKRVMRSGVTNIGLSPEIPHTTIFVPCGKDPKGADGNAGMFGEQGPSGNEGEPGKVCRVRSDQVNCE